MMLDQHEAAQFGAKMAADAARQPGDHRAPVRRHPTFAAIAHDMRAKHEVLDDEVFVALEPRAWRYRRFDDSCFVNDPFGGLVAAASVRRRRRLDVARPLHPARTAPRCGPAGPFGP